MRRPILLLFACIVGSLSFIHAQEAYTVFFQSGKYTYPANLERFIEHPDFDSDKVQNNVYRYIQFHQIPTPKQQTELAAKGIDLLDYIPRNTYLARIPVSINLQEMRKMNIRSIFKPAPEQKIAKALANDQYPDWAIQGDQIALIVQFPMGLNPYWVQSELAKQNILLDRRIPGENNLYVLAPLNNWMQLAELPYITYN